jgi:hypothetical protein
MVLVLDIWQWAALAERSLMMPMLDIGTQPYSLMSAT